MQVVSLNAERTVSPRQIAFNLDEPISQEQLLLLEYGVLTFKADGTVLVVTLPAGDDTPFTEDNVASLNAKLADIALEFQNRARKRQKMLEMLARTTGLPLG